jgi:hypothetical protein
MLIQRTNKNLFVKSAATAEEKALQQQKEQQQKAV